MCVEQKRSRLRADILMKEVLSPDLQVCRISSPQRGVSEMRDEDSPARGCSRMISVKK